MRVLLASCLLALARSSGAAKAPLDNFTPTCSKTDPNLNDCVKKSSQLLIPALVKGIRDYNFPPIDPLKIPFLMLSQSDKPVGLKLNITDTTHEGISDLQVTSAKMNMKQNKWEINLIIPKYTITGICDLGGRILLLPISGHGFCNLTSNAMDVQVKIDATPTKGKNGKEHYKLSKFDIKLTFHKGSFLLEGLFGGNKELGSTMNRFLNENAVEVLNEMKGTLQDTFSEVFGGLIRRIFAVVPSDGVFKP